MTHANEFPHEVVAARIGPEPTTVTFAADERQRALLAKRYGIVSVDSLTGTATLRRESDGMTIAVTGHFKADVTQACVTTLEPVKDRIEEDFEGWYLDESQAASFARARKRKASTQEDAPELMPEDDEHPISEEQDEPEPVVGGVVDVGELAAQYLSLALNPYPHSEKALREGPLGEDNPAEKTSPFDVLKSLKT